MTDPEAQWKQCDADGAGKVLFDEFCDWSIKRNLDLEDDDDDDDNTDSELSRSSITRDIGVPIQRNRS